jgi:hypothetical protein
MVIDVDQYNSEFFIMLELILTRVHFSLKFGLQVETS